MIELMLALAIVALLLLIGMPSFTTFLRNSEVRSTAEAMINGLRMSTAEAANRNTKVTFTLDGGGSGDWAITWVLTADDYGRDHHPRAFTIWLAGGGVRPGITLGETDDYGYNITQDPVHIHDLNATILRCLGIDLSNNCT